MKKIFTFIAFVYCMVPALVNAQGIYQLFGATGYGGPEDRGSFFTTKFDGTGHSVKKFLSVPHAGGAGSNNKPVVYNGKLYSALTQGGLHDYGIISEYDPATGIYRKMADFYSIGEQGTRSGMVVYNNKLYGTTYEASPGIQGALFEFNPSNGALTKHHVFESNTGHGSLGDLFVFNNKIYGIAAFGGANGDGTIFEFDPATKVYSKKKDLETTLHGGYGYCAFTQYNGKLWAVTSSSDGPLKGGYLFSYDPATNVVSSKLELGSISADYFDGALTVVNNKMYGVADDKLQEHGSVLFEYDPILNTLTRKKVLTQETGYGSTTLRVHSGILYGTTVTGNANDRGTIFSYDPVNNVYNTKVIFSNAMGGSPANALTLHNNKFYGFTNSWVYGTTGALFEYNPAINSFTTKIELGSDDVFRPNGKMTLHNNKLYGVGSSGGTDHLGGIFSFDPVTFNYTTLYELQGLDGYASEQGGLTLFNNKFYGVTHWGGVNDQGVVFTFDPATNSYAKLFDFGGANGERPTGRMVEYGDKLYGTCSQGGNNDNGTIFELNPATNLVSIKVLFDDTRGSHPNGGLLLYNGKIFGTAAGGGAHHNGTLFEYLPLANGLIKRADFKMSITGYAPVGGLVGYNNKLYGLTAYGEMDHYSGKLYEFDLANNLLTPKVDLSPSIGRNAIARMTVVGNKLVGMTNIGGDYLFGGVLFEYDPELNSYSTRTKFTVENGRLPRNNELVKLPAPAAPGSANSCTNANFATINAANANEWIAFTDAEGRAVAEINANGNILGNVQARFYINDGDLRLYNGTPYANRNVTITTQFTPATPVTVRLYLKNSEFLTLRNTAGSGVVLPPDISVFKNNDFCAANIIADATMLPTTHTTWGTDHVYTTEVTSFSSFYFAASSKALPVHLLSFSGKEEPAYNVLSWKATCTGQTSFFIERSTDGNSYATIGIVNAADGNCDLPFYYNDVQPPQGKSFYRLRINENNSADKYSNVLVLNRKSGNEVKVEIIPNPVTSGQADLRITSAATYNARIKLVDINGKTLFTTQAVLQPGINPIKINVASLSAGLYYLQYTDGQNNKTIKLIKQ